MPLVYVPAGEFMMGSPEGEAGRNASRESPLHQVRLTRPFYLGKCEVTTGEFAHLVESQGYQSEAERRGHGRVWNGERCVNKPDASWTNPYYEQTARHPVVLVSWNDAQAFLKWLGSPSSPASASGPVAGAERDGSAAEFRLPTEAQWEFACRSGTSTRYSFGDDPEGVLLPDYAWFGTNAGGAPHPVGKKKPNGWGLHDMLGNVGEWTASWFGRYPSVREVDPVGPKSGADKVQRGGCYYGPGNSVRPASRGINQPFRAHTHCGFRVALSVSVADLTDLARQLRPAEEAGRAAAP